MHHHEMHDVPAEPISVEVEGWRVITSPDLPTMLSEYRGHALLHDDLGEPERRDAEGFCFVAIGRADETWPSLVVTQPVSPSEGGFAPGVLIVPETNTAFIGAGTRLLCYQHDSGRWTRLWEDRTDMGFWGWRRHGDIVVMSAEIEMAAWKVSGTKLWTTFVEPPWSYEVIDGTVELDMMGTRTSFPLETGRAHT
jgi:hypothetical protein